MRRALALLFVLGGIIHGNAQGTVEFQLDGPHLKQVIYNADPANTGTLVSYNGYTISELQGSTGASPETPTGTTVYAGSLLTGTDYSAELFGAAGAGLSLQGLQPLLSGNGTPAILTFFTGGVYSGLIQGATAVVVPGNSTDLHTPSTVAVAVWYNGGGLYTTLAAAQAQDADVPNSAPWGFSATTTVDANLAPYIPGDLSTSSDPNLSFSLGTVLVPEPGVVCLTLLGASTLFARRFQQTKR